MNARPESQASVEKTPGTVSIFGVASPYAFEVVESAERLGLAVTCIDTFGTADALLPNLELLSDTTHRVRPFAIGLTSAGHRGAALHAGADAGFTVPHQLIDPTATMARRVTLGHAVYVNAGAVVGSRTHLGCAVNINRSASIGHDNDIGFSASVGPGAVLAGHVRLGTSVSVGAGAIVLPRVVVHDGATVGAGAVVTRDVAPFEVVVGNPARVLKESEVTPLLTCPFCDAA